MSTERGEKEREDSEFEVREVYQETIDSLKSPLDLAAARVAVRRGYIKIKNPREASQ